MTGLLAMIAVTVALPAAAARAIRGGDVPAEIARLFGLKRLSSGARSRMAVAAGTSADLSMRD